MDKMYSPSQMMTPGLVGKICMVTGASSGIGKAIGLGLAKTSATVVMVARDRSRIEAARDEIEALSGNRAIEMMAADLSSMASVRELARSFARRHMRLHLLVNNAGVQLWQRSITADGYETTFAVNYLAPFLLTNLLLDTLKASAPARVCEHILSGLQVGEDKLRRPAWGRAV